MRGQILRGDSILTLTTNFSRVMRVSTDADVFPAPSVEHSVMISRRGRGRSRGHDFGGHGSFEGGRGSYGGRQSGRDKGPRQCKYCRRNNHISEKCWGKFGRPEWAQLVDIVSPTYSGATHVPSSIPPGGSSGSSTVVLSQEKYDRLRQLELS